ncbi:MAG: hypothetical protein WA004_08690 [Saprospiraceae bacterium]
MVKGVREHPLFLKVFVWEYWPMWMGILPTIFFWLWFALRARRLFFFSAVNPSIETGGMMGESKHRIMNHIPEEYLPDTVFVKRGMGWEEVAGAVRQKGLVYPLIAKPDVGERGFQVVVARDEGMLRAYHARNDMDFLIQDFVELPEEVSILYHRFPGAEKGAITSICLKEFLGVRGDGRSSVRQLMEREPRASLQVARFEQESPDKLAAVPAEGERLLLEPIGNHCRGTKFLSGNHLIDAELTAVFDRISHRMEGICYGRFDMKCGSIEALRRGQDFKILEFNGASAEPAHVYDPAIPVWKKYRDIFRHWQIMYHIYLAQRERGYEAMSFGEAREAWKRYWRYMKTAK